MTQNKLRIDTGVVTVEVNDAGEEICFTPDVYFVERFNDLYDVVMQKAEELKRREEELKANDAADDNEIPANRRERIALIKESCLFLHEKINELFGAGTCEKALGGALNPDCYIELLEALTPFIQNARKNKMNKYAKK